MNNKKTGSKGGSFEERLRAYFDHVGFLAVRGVPFVFEGDDVSDIDVWLYERPNATSRRRTIIDAKNKQRPRAIERIIWLKGFQQGLGVENAIVATTDRRPAVRRFASSLGISMLDGEALDRLFTSQTLDSSVRMDSEALERMISAADAQHGSKEWRSRYLAGKGSLATNLGYLSANENIEHGRFFLESALMKSDSAKETAARAFLIVVSFSAISLDYAARDLSFRSYEERRDGITLGLRFGESASNDFDALKLAIGLVRQYADNGGALARQIQTRLNDAAKSIPVELISEFIAKVITKDTLFKVARELDSAGHSTECFKYDDLSVDARSYIGVLLDFYGVPRKRIDEIFPYATAKIDQAGARAGENEKTGQLPLEVAIRSPSSEIRSPSSEQAGET